jgi:hypothetical protein
MVCGLAQLRSGSDRKLDEFSAGECSSVLELAPQDRVEISQPQAPSTRSGTRTAAACRFRGARAWNIVSTYSHCLDHSRFGILASRPASCFYLHRPRNRTRLANRQHCSEAPPTAPDGVCACSRPSRCVRRRRRSSGRCCRRVAASSWECSRWAPCRAQCACRSLRRRSRCA